MSDIFNKVTEGVKSTIKIATDQTQDAVAEISCRRELSAKRTELSSTFERIGQISYIKHKGDEIDSIEVAELIKKVDTLAGEVAALEDQLAGIYSSRKESFDNYKTTVKSTWEDIKQTATNTSKKGQPDFDNTTTIETKECTVCHVHNNVHSAYCISCGHKFENDNI